LSDAKLDQILAEISGLRSEVSGLKSEMGGFRTRLDSLESKVDRMEKRHDDFVAAFREFWSEMSALYRASRQELREFELRMEAKIGDVSARLEGLRSMIEAQDYHARVLAQRVTRLEAPPETPPL
jgi:exonuclease VII small subunit